jgi:GTP-sensing pleiotropic transcriptional regulator CodY
VTGDIRQRLTEALGLSWDELERQTIAAALEQTVRDLIADELEAVAQILDGHRGQITAGVTADSIHARATAVRARTEETTR